jgi:hypothetical protein
MSTKPAAPITAAQSAAVLGQDLPFWYPINVALGAGLGGFGSVTMDNDADFELREIIANSTGRFTVALLDRFTSRPMMPTTINDQNVFGTAQLPFILPIPYIILRTSTIAATLLDLSGNPNAVQLILWGYKKFGS